jgi:haloalkane dehalogenase
MSDQEQARGGTPRSISHSGGVLYVLDRPGDGVPVVAMHGFPDDLRIYDHLLPQLPGRRVVRFDWFGYGHSSRRGPNGYEPGARQRELVTVLDDLDLDDAVLVAHDASGPEAVDFALAQPDRIRHLVLLNTYYGRSAALHLPEMIGLFANPEFAALADALVEDELQRLWLIQFAARRFGRDPDDPTDIGNVSVLPQFFGEADQPDALAEIRAWTADLPRALDNQDERIAAGDLKTLPVPVTIAFGTTDPFLNPGVARELAGQFARAELHLVEGASHWLQWDRPEAIAPLIPDTGSVSGPT